MSEYEQLRMITNISIKCTVDIPMGDIGGYHAEDTLRQIRAAFIRDGTKKLSTVLESSESGITFRNPKFSIVLGDK